MDMLMNDDDFDPEGAMEAAVNKRKFLINRRKKCIFVFVIPPLSPF